MKFAIGPRQIGKTYALASELLKMKGDVLWLSLTRQQNIIAAIPKVIELLEEQKTEYTYNKIAQTIVTKNLTIHFDSFNHYLNERRSSKTKMPKIIDNVEFLLEEQFTNVKLISGTGPNKNFKISKKYQEGLDEIKSRVSEEEFENDFTAKW